MVVGMVGCGGPPGTETTNGGGITAGGDPSLGGHVQAGCTQDEDCLDPANPCSKNRCDPSTKTCVKGVKTCTLPASASSECNAPSCDPTDGSCGATPTNEGMSCSTTDGNPGLCNSGSCTAVPTCYMASSFGNSISCGGYDATSDDSNTSASYSTTNATSTYGNCAQNETAPEVAYQFAVTADQQVTFKLEPRAATSGGAIVDVDLDLIVVEGSCTEAASCVNPSRTDGGFQGITPGTAKERVSFRAKAGVVYYVIVDGKNSAQGYYHLSLEACGACQPTPTTTLACNVSMPLAGDTAAGTNELATYTCATNASGGTATVAAAGNEQSFLFVDDAMATRKVTAKVTGASTDVTLLALPVGASYGSNYPGACDPEACLASAASASGTASITWDTVGNSSYSPTTSYWVVVDTAQAASNATFGLELSCPAYCSFSGYSADLTCTNKDVGASQRNDQDGSSNANSQWGPAAAPCGGLTNLAGPEYVYLLQTPAVTPKNYAVTLSTITAGKSLALVLMDAGTTLPSSCTPTLACAEATGSTHIATAGGADAVVKFKPAATGAHYYWVIVDGVTAADKAEFTLELSSGCN